MSADVDSLRDETVLRLRQMELLANTTRSAAAWSDYIASCRYYEGLLLILDRFHAELAPVEEPRVCHDVTTTFSALEDDWRAECHTCDWKGPYRLAPATAAGDAGVHRDEDGGC